MLRNPEFWIAYIVVFAGIIGREALDRFLGDTFLRLLFGNDLYVLLAAAAAAFGGALIRGLILRFQSPTNQFQSSIQKSAPRFER